MVNGENFTFVFTINESSMLKILPFWLSLNTSSKSFFSRDDFIFFPRDLLALIKEPFLPVFKISIFKKGDLLKAFGYKLK